MERGCDKDKGRDKANCHAFVQGNTDDAHHGGEMEKERKQGEPCFQLKWCGCFHISLLPCENLATVCVMMSVSSLIR